MVCDFRAHHADRQARPRRRGKGQLLIMESTHDRSTQIDSAEERHDPRRRSTSGSTATCARSAAPRARRRLPARDRRADEGAGPVRRDHPGRSMAAWACRPSTYAKIVEKISSVWMSLSGIFNSHLIMALSSSATARRSRRRRFLPHFATGELRGGLALTEPDCGTDLQAIRTARACATATTTSSTAPRPGSRNGIYGNCFALLVKTDPKAEPRHKGMSLFIAEKGEGFTRRPASWRSWATRASTPPSSSSRTTASRRTT